MKSTSRHLVVAISVALGAAATALVGPASVADPGAHDRASSTDVVVAVHKAIAPFEDVSAALDAGYVPMGHCEESPAGGMGIHYMNPAYGDPSAPVSPDRPTVLLYGPDGDGGLRLLGAEFWQPAVGQPTPTLDGQPFDGPMPGHVEGMPTHFDLHVWTEVANPAGVFAPWNPRVHC